MKSIIRTVLCHILNAAITAGVIILFIGLYYAVFKAGIPYQDPTPELQIRYEVNYRIGGLLTESGFAVTICGGVLRLLVGLLWKKSNINDILHDVNTTRPRF